MGRKIYLRRIRRIHSILRMRWPWCRWQYYHITRISHIVIMQVPYHAIKGSNSLVETLQTGVEGLSPGQSLSYLFDVAHLLLLLPHNDGFSQMVVPRGFFEWRAAKYQPMAWTWRENGSFHRCWGQKRDSVCTTMEYHSHRAQYRPDDHNNVPPLSKDGTKVQSDDLL